MTVSSGFVVVNNDGFYAREYSVITHGGTDHRIEWVKDLNLATAFINKAYTLKRHKELSSKVAMTVEVTRTVKITGVLEK